MKNRIEWRSCLAAMLAMTMLAISCKDDATDVTEQLSVSQARLDIDKSGLTYDGTEAVVEVTSDAFWLMTVSPTADWLSAAPMAAGGPAKITISASPNPGMERTAELRLETLAGTRATLTIHQGAASERTVYLRETFGTGASMIPVGDFDGWNASGIGISETAYAGTGVNIDAEEQSSGYNDASAGNNVLFSKVDAPFTIGPVALYAGIDLRLRFGAWFPAGTDVQHLRVQASRDAKNWTELLCSRASTAGWAESLSEFYVDSKEVDKLYFRFTSRVPGVRIDDVCLIEGEPGEGELLEFNTDVDDGKEAGYVYFEDRFDWDTAEFGGTDFIGDPTVGGSETRFDLVKDERLKEILVNSGWTMAAEQPYAYLRLGYLKMGKTLMAGAVLTPKLEKIATGTSVDLIVTFDATVQEYKGVKDLDGLIVEAVGGGTVNGDTSISARIDTESWNTWRTCSVVVRKATSKTQIRFGCAWDDADMKAQNKSNRFYLDNVRVTKAPRTEE